MLPNDPHLTDHDIVLLVDGELEAGLQRRMREHVKACWSCRSRVAEIEGTIADFVHVYRDSLDPKLPPVAGPRALLRAQMANQSVQKSGWWERLFAAHRATSPATIAASLMVACLAVIAIYARGTARRPGDLSIPKNSLTPGETRSVTIGDVCSGTSDRDARAVPVSLKQQVFRAYGIEDTRPNAYEVDYLITPELGGSSSIRNLWPEPDSALWNAHV
jgi:hypothetical protein